MENPILSLIFPTYNEAENIRILIPEIFKVFQNLDLEIIIVDDGSTDGTLAIIKNLKKNHPNIFLIERKELLGIGSALIAGYGAAKGKYIISSDSDLSFPAEDLRRIADVLFSDKYDLALGSRYLKDSYYEAPNFDILKKKMVSKFGNIFLRFITGIPISDFSANCRGVKNAVWKSISVKSQDNFMLFETIWRVYLAGGSITEVPVKFYNRKFGATKLNLKKEIFIFLRQLIKLYIS